MRSGVAGISNSVTPTDSRAFRIAFITAAGAPVAPPSPIAGVAFATRVTIDREDGRRQRLAIVGEDEADPAKGAIAYSSPLARALMGRRPGEAVDVPGGEVEIVSLEAIDPEG